MKARFADFVFDSEALELRRGEVLVDLQPKVLQFLGVLLEHEGRTVAQRELLDRLWPGVAVGLDSLTRVASLGRRALDDGSEKRLIETRRGVGYRIGVPVEIRDADEEAKHPHFSARDEDLGPSVVAVLPFSNLGPNEADAYFADGLSDDLIVRLSRTRTLSVIGRASSFSFRGTGVDLAEVGRALGVRYVVVGSVRRSSDRVRVNAQLIDVPSRLDLWADRYDRELVEIFAAQDELTEAIVSALLPNLDRAEQHRAMARRGNDIGAWDTMLKGIWHLERYTQEELVESLTLLRRATELDPNLVGAWSNLANALFIQLYYGWADDPTAAFEEARRTAQRALSLEDTNSTAHFVMAWVHLFGGDHTAARIAAERAVELNPSASAAHWALGVSLTGLGMPEEGALAIEEAIRLSPLAFGMRLYLQNLGIAYMMSSRFEGAVEVARRSLTYDPDQAAPHRLLAACHGHLGDGDKAEATMNEAMRLEPEFSLEELRRFNPPAIVDQLSLGWAKGGIQLAE